MNIYSFSPVYILQLKIMELKLEFSKDFLMGSPFLALIIITLELQSSNTYDIIFYKFARKFFWIYFSNKLKGSPWRKKSL